MEARNRNLMNFLCFCYTKPRDRLPKPKRAYINAKGELVQVKEEDLYNSDSEEEENQGLKEKFLSSYYQLYKYAMGHYARDREQLEVDLKESKQLIVLERKRAIYLRRKIFKGVSEKSTYIKLKQSLLYSLFILTYFGVLFTQIRNAEQLKSTEYYRTYLKNGGTSEESG